MAAVALRDGEIRYTYERFSLALKGRAPAEKPRTPRLRVAYASHVYTQSTLEPGGQS